MAQSIRDMSIKELASRFVTAEEHLGVNSIEHRESAAELERRDALSRTLQDMKESLGGDANWHRLAFMTWGLADVAAVSMVLKLGREVLILQGAGIITEGTALSPKQAKDLRLATAIPATTLAHAGDHLLKLYRRKKWMEPSILSLFRVFDAKESPAVATADAAPSSKPASASPGNGEHS